MSENDRDKLNRIEELKGKLFSKNYQIKAEHRDKFTHREDTKVPDSWQTEEEEIVDYGEKFFMKTSIFKNFLIFSVGFFVLALLYASYVLFAGSNTVSNDNIDILISGNSFTAGSEELSMIVGIANKNNLPLDLVDLIVEYPKNPSTGGDDSSLGTERFRESLGTIPAGALRNENIKVVLFGEQGTVIPVKVSMEYRVEGSNAIFVKEKIHDVVINSTPLNILVDAPDTVSPNQDITLKVKVSLNATKPAPKMLLRIEYPVGFQFTSSTPSPSLSNNVWTLGDLAPGSEHNITITGRMLDVFDGEEKTFRVSGGSQSSGEKSAIDVVFNSMIHTVLVKKPFIETRFLVNGIYQREYAVNATSLINGEIEWTNNLDTKVNDLEIRAKISGNAVNRKTINPQQGFYNSSEDVITWDRNSRSKFREIDPGESGSVIFSVSPLSLFSADRGLLSDPSINIEISISGKQSLEGYATSELNGSESSKIKIISDVSFTPKALYYSGPFTNSGPIPPEVEKETTYTITWTLSNTANNISKASLRSTIPSWVRFVGPISPSSENLVYNASTREITWNIGRIPKGTSITQAGKSVSFQIAFKPSLSQVGTTPVILNESVLTGHDDFANVDVKVTKTSLRTTLDNNPPFPGGGGIVVE